MKSQIWTRNQIDLARAAIEERLAPLTVSAAVEACLDVVASGSFQSSDQALQTLLYCLKSLELNASHLLLTQTQQKKVVDVASALLATNGIKPTTSKLSFLYGQLHMFQAAAMQAQGQTWEALWQAQVGRLTSRKAPVVSQAHFSLEAATSAARLGQSDLAISLLNLARETGLDSEETVQMDLLRAQLLGRTERRGEARSLCQRLSLVDRGMTTDVVWRLAWLDAMDKGGPDPLIRVLRQRGGPDFPINCWIEAWLWTRCLPNLDCIRRLPTLRTIRDRPQFRGTLMGATSVFAGAAQKLDQMYDNERPLEHRMLLGSAIMNDISRFPDLEHEILMLAALFRWTIRYNQMETAAFVLEEYRQRCMRASKQLSNDLLKACDNVVPERLLGRYLKDKEPGADDIAGPRTPVAKRAYADLLKTVTKLAAQSLRSRLSLVMAGKDAKDQITVQNKRQMAKILFDFATRTGGLSLKIGQMCSYLEGPVDAAIVDQFESLQHHAPTMSSGAARNIFEAEFGKLPEEVFSYWEDEPFAAGTIGQVHKARLRDGTAVAVKIQFEGIRDRINTDFRRAALLKPFFLNLIPNLDVDALLAEAQEVLMAETDYKKEQENMTWYRETFGQEPGVLVPEVFKEFSSNRVLTTEFVDGQTLQDFLFTASEAERLQAATTIVRMTLRANFNFGFLLADPHPGNFLFKSGKVCFIDFGCVKRYPQPFFTDMIEMTRAFFRGDRRDFHRLFCKIGMIHSEDDLTPDESYDLFAGVKRTCLKDEPFVVSHEVVRDIFLGFSTENPHRAIVNVPKDILFSARIEFGLYSLISRFEVPMNWYRLHCEALGMSAAGNFDLLNSGDQPA